MSDKNNNNNKNEKKKKDFSEKQHFWIPNSEVEFVNHKPRNIKSPLDIDHVEHGKALSEGISLIKKAHNQKKTPISDELVIFQVELNEGKQADNRGDYKEIFEKNKMKINAIGKSNVAIVSASPSNLENLNKKVKKYTDKNGKSYNFFQYIKSISHVEAEHKQTIQLIEEKKTSNDIVDMQVTLVPKLSTDLYEKILGYLMEQIKSVNGEIGEDGIYFLSDNTPVLRILVPSSGIDVLTEQEIILRAEQSPFFEISNQKNTNAVDIKQIPLEFQENPDELPIVCILDDGIQFPDSLNDCVAGTWKADGITDSTSVHGTKVASRAIFGDDLESQVSNNKLIPKVRVINAVISDGTSPIYEGTMINRIQQAVEAIRGVTSVFCLCFNDNRYPIGDDNIGNLAYEIDCLIKTGVNFVIPSGNHNLWKFYNSLDDILDDSSSRISAPSESFFAVTVGAITNDYFPKSVAGKNELAPFSRVGYGFSGSYKPEIVYPGGNVYMENNQGYIAPNSAAYVINKNGFLEPEFGTSFSAPLAAADLAQLTVTVPDQDPLIAKALLMHHAKIDDTIILDTEFEERMYGRGVGDYQSARSSNPNRATYIRRGKMERLVKHRVRFWMPSTLADVAQKKKQVAKITVTCLYLPPIDKGMGVEYLRGYIDTSLHSINSNGKSVTTNPSGKKGRKEWQNFHHFEKVFSVFDPGDWQIWLQLFSKPEVTEEINYALIVTVENLTEENVSVHEGIEVETGTRFQNLTEVPVSIEDIS